MSRPLEKKFLYRTISYSVNVPKASGPDAIGDALGRIFVSFDRRRIDGIFLCKIEGIVVDDLFYILKRVAAKQRL